MTTAHLNTSPGLWRHSPRYPREQTGILPQRCPEIPQRYPRNPPQIPQDSKNIPGILSHTTQDLKGTPQPQSKIFRIMHRDMPGIHQGYYSRDIPGIRRETIPEIPRDPPESIPTISQGSTRDTRPGGIPIATEILPTPVISQGPAERPSQNFLGTHQSLSQRYPRDPPRIPAQGISR